MTNRSLFERPIQCAAAVGEVYGIDRTTLTRNFHSEGKPLGDSAYQSKNVILIDTSHKDFQAWLTVHWQQSRVKGRVKQKGQNATNERNRNLPPQEENR